MNYYISHGTLQQQLTEYYQTTGKKLQFQELVSRLYEQKLLSETPLPGVPFRQIFDDMPDQEIDHILDALVLTLDLDLGFGAAYDTSRVLSSDIIPTSRDVFISRHWRYTRPLPHTHNYFEINYVASGQCTLMFEDKERKLSEGELCIIAPGSRHEVVIEDESTVFCIMVRKETFDRNFFSLLSENNLLSQFFRTFLSESGKTNYLLFFCDQPKTIRVYILNALAECYKADSCSNTTCISWLNLLFAALIRDYSGTLQFYDYEINSEFSLVMQYIQHNYRHLSLSALAEFFHYSEPYLSTLIKKSTGENYIDLVKNLRLADAEKYLTNTHMTIAQIAEEVGYNSSDHFSRIFRSAYGISPQRFRKEHKAEHDAFVPFHMLQSDQ